MRRQCPRQRLIAHVCAPGGCGTRNGKVAQLRPSHHRLGEHLWGMRKVMVIKVKSAEMWAVGGEREDGVIDWLDLEASLIGVEAYLQVITNIYDLSHARRC